MKCSTFKSKLNEYMEDDLLYDGKKAMEDHMKQCENCRKLYEEEKSIDDYLRGAFKLEEVKFNSSRQNIMKSLDKDRYSNSWKNRIGLHVKKYQLKYLTYAALLTIVFISAPFINDSLRDFSFGGSKKENAASLNESVRIAQMDSMDKSDTGSEAIGEAVEFKAADSSRMEQANIKSTNEFSMMNIYMPTFEKMESTREPEKGMATTAKTSPDGTIKAQLDGRGISAGDEGIADIYVVKSAKEKWRLQLVNNEVSFTPMYLEWLDNENILITMGYAYGHATYGGSVYRVNINTAEVFLVYEVDSDIEQVAVIETTKENVKLTVKVFIDEIKNKTKDDIRTIDIATALGK